MSFLLRIAVLSCFLIVTLNSQADTQSADEAAWLSHLKHAHIKNGLNRNGDYDSNIVNAGWEVIPGAGEDNIVLTNQDLRYLLSAMGNKASRRPLTHTDLRYQAEVGDNLLQVKFFYNF